ncbi:NUDIX domain-containing protein [Streptomyces sp. TLI_171]|uniref:NUDIX domain-containing protein n=1 Tax=Streptomyces sp. TLI_171 TaxID=1938859 RepID=UPI000C19A526|nr:NUDIX domain-containing protein [Streptomyces sp. TLI_171]RKE21930.1 NUDIX domain-containing protein [Streptomyces sp. TLI_171]
MPPPTDAVAALTRTYLERYPAERDRLQPLLTAPDPGGGRSLDPHVTSSAVVINRDLQVLHIRPGPDGSTPCAGGRGEDAGAGLLAAALREAERAGIPPGALCLVPQLLDGAVDIDVQDVAPNPGTGEGVHRHYDVRFAFYLADTAASGAAPRAQDADGFQWRPFDEVDSPSLRAKLRAAGLDGKPEPVNASVLIHDGFGRYLLHLRDDFDHIWAPGEFSLLGGGAEAGDGSLEGTLRRELAEEVPGLRLGQVEPLTVEWTTGANDLAVPIQIFAAQWRGDPREADLREGVLLHWFGLEDLHRLRLRASTGQLIRDHHAAVLRRVQQDAGQRAAVVLDGRGRAAQESAAGRSGAARPDTGVGDSWTTLSSSVEFAGARLAVRRDSVRRPDGSVGTYEYTQSRDGVRVVALDDRGRIALVEEYVYACGRRLLLCPGGGCEADEEPRDAALRELAEEAGVRAAEVELLTRMWRMPAGARTLEHLYLARGLSVGAHHREASEADMTLRWVALEEAVQMCGDGRITEAGTLAAVLLAAQRTTARSAPAATGAGMTRRGRQGT